MNNLDTEMIVLNKAFASKKEAMRFCGQKLVDAGCVDSEYVEAMMQRDRMLSVYMGNFIAIPHGRDSAKEHVKKSGICVV